MCNFFTGFLTPWGCFVVVNPVLTPQSPFGQESTENLEVSKKESSKSLKPANLSLNEIQPGAFGPISPIVSSPEKEKDQSEGSIFGFLGSKALEENKASSGNEPTTKSQTANEGKVNSGGIQPDPLGSSIQKKEAKSEPTGFSTFGFPSSSIFGSQKPPNSGSIFGSSSPAFGFSTSPFGSTNKEENSQPQQTSPDLQSFGNLKGTSQEKSLSLIGFGQSVKKEEERILSPSTNSLFSSAFQTSKRETNPGKFGLLGTETIPEMKFGSDVIKASSGGFGTLAFGAKSDSQTTAQNSSTAFQHSLFQPSLEDQSASSQNQTSSLSFGTGNLASSDEKLPPLNFGGPTSATSSQIQTSQTTFGSFLGQNSQAFSGGFSGPSQPSNSLLGFGQTQASNLNFASSNGQSLGNFRGGFAGFGENKSANPTFGASLGQSQGSSSQGIPTFGSAFTPSQTNSLSKSSPASDSQSIPGNIFGSGSQPSSSITFGSAWKSSSNSSFQNAQSSPSSVFGGSSTGFGGQSNLFGAQDKQENALDQNKDKATGEAKWGTGFQQKQDTFQSMTAPSFGKNSNSDGPVLRGEFYFFNV